MKSLRVVLLIMVAIMLIACDSSDSSTHAATELSVRASDIAYNLNQIETVAGKPMQLTLYNDGVLEHDLTIVEIPYTGEIKEEEMGGHDMGHLHSEPELHVSALPGDSNVIEFTPSAPGEFEFFCAVKGHKEAGMVGTLVVIAP